MCPAALPDRNAVPALKPSAQSKGYEHWAKIHNLKQAAKTMNFLTENKIEQYADLVSRTLEVAAESEQAADTLKSVEKRLADMAVLMKHVATYQKTKPVYDAYRKTCLFPARWRLPLSAACSPIRGRA